MSGSGKELVPVRRGTGGTQYTLELAQHICERIAAGETLIDICAEPGMPKETTVRGWDFDDRKGNPTPASGFAAMYARAVEMRVEHELDRLRQLAATPVLGKTVTDRQLLTKDGDIVQVREIKYADAIEARRLEIDALKWRIGKIGWRVYGARAPVAEKSDSEAINDPNTLTIIGGLPDDTAPPPPPPYMDEGKEGDG